MYIFGTVFLSLKCTIKSWYFDLIIYSMPTKVPYHPLNFGTVAAIFINVVSRYSKLDMCYQMRLLTAPPGLEWLSKLSYLKNERR